MPSSLDPLVLSRIQFALNSMFHYIFPPMSIGLGLMLIIFEGIYLKTKEDAALKLVKFWTRIYALMFAMGVSTGLVLSFAFGTNWAKYSRFVGDVFGAALGAEGLFAFFLEAGFIGIVLFGWNRVSKGMHYFATWMVALGAHLSGVWIIVANSWMHTPAGYKIVGEGEEARAVVTDFWAMIFNPSFMDRITHVILGCWLSGIFLVLSVAAYYYIQKKHEVFAKQMMKISLWAGAVVLILHLISADSTARGVAINQPAKLAAMEGVLHTKPGPTPITVMGYVDAEGQAHGIQIPWALSIMTNRGREGVKLLDPVRALDTFPKEDRPNVQVVFQTYHIMVSCWGAMVFLVALGLWYYRKGTLREKKWLLWPMVFSVALPHLANQTGWITAEMGRQPWIVYGLLRTSQGLSPNISGGQVLTSIIMFSIIYALMFAMFIYILNGKIQHGPSSDDKENAIVYRPIPNLESKKP